MPPGSCPGAGVLLFFRVANFAKDWPWTFLEIDWLLRDPLIREYVQMFVFDLLHEFRTVRIQRLPIAATSFEEPCATCK